MLNNYSGIAAVLQRLALTALLAGGTALAAQAQFTYTPGLASNVAGTYTDLGANGNAIAVSSTDDANSAATDIGFTFNFNGTAFTQFVLNTNGLLRLGASAPAQALAASAYAQDPTTGPINSGDAADTNLIMPFNFDLTAGTSRPEYRVYTTGTAGSRVCTIQWKNVSDKEVTANSTTSTTVPTQFGNFSFQVKLYEGSNQVDFVYDLPTSLGTSGLKYVVVGLKGSAASSSLLASKNSTAAWSTTAFFTGPQPAPSAGNANNIRSVAPPDAGRTYRFVQAVPNDATVFDVYTLGKLPTTALPTSVSAAIINSGTTALTNVPVTLTVSGANSFTNTQTIASLAVGAGVVVTFSSLPNTFTAGVNNVAVSIPNDGNNSNNSLSTQQTVNGNGVFSYVPSNQSNTYYSSVGAVANAAGTGSNGAIFGSVFTAGTGGTIPSVRVFLTDANSVGKTVQGVILSSAGAVIGSSANYVIQSADINTYHTFAITTPPTVASGSSFLAGLSQPAYTGTRNFPVAYQQESTGRTGTFLYYASPTGGVTPTDLPGYRFLIEATVLNALATNSPALARAIDVYPNPSTSGVFSLDVRGANTAAGLGVEVADQLGRRVYTGSARDNFATTLDLSNLAPGIYHLTLRNGEQFTSRRISIVK